MISIELVEATKSLWLNDVAKAIFLASLKSVKGTFLRYRQYRNPVYLDYLSGHATDQIHIFLALTSRSHHDQCRMILLAIGDDLLLPASLHVIHNRILPLAIRQRTSSG